MKDKLSILVVEDNELHQNAAEQLLEGHDVEIVNAFDYATDVLVGTTKYVTEDGKHKVLKNVGKKDYDVVLTDLFYKQGRGDNQSNKMLARDQLPFGYALMLIAAEMKVPYCAIVTDMNHHNHPLAHSFDFLKNPLTINDTRCMLFDQRDLDGLYLLKEGSFTTAGPYMAPNDKTKYVPKGEYGFETAKNWKGALEILIGVENEDNK